MIINKKDLNLPIENRNDVYVVADFDRTITDDSSKTSWSILVNSRLLPISYTEEEKTLYNKYRPIELDETINYQKRSYLMKEWVEKHINLFIKYQIKEEIFVKAAKNMHIISFRPGAKEFLEFLHQNKIPLIIISAGIGNFVEYFLKNNNCYYDNIFISSNKIIFNNGLASNIDQNIIHSLNKNEVVLPDVIKDKINNRHKVILLGDQPGDLKMVTPQNNKEVISIALYTQESHNDVLKYYTIVCEKEDTYFDIKKLLFK